MTGEEPVDPGEFVLRCIHRNNFDASQPVSVLRCEFEPKPRDAEGLSCYREQLLSAEQLANSGRSPGACYVARIAVQDLLALGLTVVPTPGDLPGHVSVPELCYSAFCADKATSKAIQRQLALLASQSIIRQPTA